MQKIPTTQAQAVKNAVQAVGTFYSEDIYSPVEIVRANHLNVIQRTKELEQHFPEVAEGARRSYWDADYREATGDYNDALYVAFVKLYAFSESKTLEGVAALLPDLNDSLYELSVWCEGYDGRGNWRF